MRKIVENIKDNSFSDYRLHVPGVICDIYECNQYVGYSSVLRVLPVGYDVSAVSSDEKLKYFNVVCCGSVGVYGFTTSIKETHRAYVLTDNPSFIEGMPALIIPKNFLYRNPGEGYKTEPDSVNKDDLQGLVMRKEILVRSRKLS